MKLVAEEVLTAAEIGNLETLRQYDRNSLTDKLCDGSGCNCLHYAARQGGAEMLQFLVKERDFVGYKRSNVGATAAHDSAAAGNLEALQWLIQYGGCKVDDQDGTGATVLHLAARFHHTHVTEWLLDVAHADVSKRTASNGLALHFAVVGGDYDAVKLLLDEDPTSANMQLNNGATATYLAAQEGHIEILRLLIQDYRGNTKVKAYDGMSVVHAAAQSGNLDCVRFLVDEEKCNANDRDFDGATPIHYAASQGHAIVIDWLMKLGGARVTLDNLGGSPLHNAAESNQEECIKVLISNGCSIEITDNNGLTAAELARKCFNNKCANLIETFEPQSQFVIDEDVAYLHSVQSPRPLIQTRLPVQTRLPAVSNGYSAVYEAYQSLIRPEPVQNGIIVNGDQIVVHAPVEAVINVQPKLRGRQSPVRAASPVDHRQRQKNPTVNGTFITDIEPERDTGSVSATADSDELPVGIPRNFSEDWSSKAKQNNRNNSQSASCSSLSSLSHLDDALAVASQEVEKDKNTQNASGYKKPETQVLSQTFLKGNSVKSKPLAAVTSVNRNTNNKSGFSLLGQKETKSVSFQTNREYILNNSASRIVSKMEEANHDVTPKDKNDNFSIVKPLGNSTVTMDKVNSNGFDGDSSDDRKIEDEVVVNSGSVIFSQNVTSIYAHTVPQNTRSHVTNLEMLRDNMHDLVDGKPTPLLLDDISQSEKSHDLVNGMSACVSDNDISKSEKSTVILTKGLTAPPAPPVSPIPASKLDKALKKEFDSCSPRDDSMKMSTFNAPLILGYGNQSSVIPPPPPAPHISHPPVYANQIDTALLSPLPASQLGIGNQPASVPPPPPPPPGTGNQSSFAPAYGSSNQTTVHNSLPEEIKRKSASLPARPVGNFTAEMMQSRRSTLTPAKAKVAIDSSASESDFLAELKQATRGPVLRKTAKSSEPGSKPLTPAMTFTSGQKTVIKDNTAESSKDSKVELTGEWDPKHFFDKVPNKDDLPAWKVQLQARQIAEKTMKDTLEKRKVEERESRFKDMPAWKRALVEKKEAEVRVAEEKRMQEQQQAKKKVTTKRVPNVNVASNQGEEGKLAPWQRELQHR